MKKILFILFLSLSVIHPAISQSSSPENEIRLLIRGDDIGCSHAANLACIDAFRNGIMRSVELMVPCPWFNEAVKLLNENPGLDVGIHLTLTSEWENYKWRPLTPAKSIVDEDGNFLPMVWPNDNYGDDYALIKQDWDINEIEKELRAQIELALKRVPHISHLSNHMGWSGADEKLGELLLKLGEEYDLRVRMDDYEIGRIMGFSNLPTLEEQIEFFTSQLRELVPGTYMFVEHPGYDYPEMQGMGHIGYDNVAQHRDYVTKVFTSEEVKKVIEEKGIRLIGYGDL